MDLQEADLTAAQEWEQSLNAACNRLSTQYLSLLRSASSTVAQQQLQQQKQQHDPRAGGGHMQSISDPPPPPLAADAGLAATQCQLAAENISVGAAHLLSLIRTLKLSLLLMDQDTIAAEEQLQVEHAQRATVRAIEMAIQIEQDLMRARNEELR